MLGAPRHSRRPVLWLEASWRARASTHALRTFTRGVSACFSLLRVFSSSRRLMRSTRVPPCELASSRCGGRRATVDLGRVIRDKTPQGAHTPGHGSKTPGGAVTHTRQIPVHAQGSYIRATEPNRHTDARARARPRQQATADAPGPLAQRPKAAPLGPAGAKGRCANPRTAAATREHTVLTRFT